MTIKIYFSDLENELLESVNACYDDLYSWIDNAMPSVIKAFFKQALKKKEVFDCASEKKTEKKKIH